VDLCAAMVTTAPFLLLALLAEVKIFGPAAGSSPRRQRREDHKTDRSIVGFLGLGFFASLFALATELDHPVLRVAAAVPLGLAAFVLGAAVLRSIRTAYQVPPTP